MLTSVRFDRDSMRWTRTAGCLLLLASLSGPGTAFSQGGKDTPRPEPPGSVPPTGSPQLRPRASGEVQAGERAPDFELDGSNGKPVRLSSLRGRWTLVAFGDRKEDVSPLREVAAGLDSSGIRLVGVCAEKAYFLEAFAKQKQFPFLLLADVTREVSDMYGLYDSHARAVLPGYILLEPDGDIALELLGQSLPANDIARLVRYISARP
jgi:peroxiredoxin